MNKYKLAVDDFISYKEKSGDLVLGLLPSYKLKGHKIEVMRGLIEMLSYEPEKYHDNIKSLIVFSQDIIDIEEQDVKVIEEIIKIENMGVDALHKAFGDNGTHLEHLKIFSKYLEISRLESEIDPFEYAKKEIPKIKKKSGCLALILFFVVFILISESV